MVATEESEREMLSNLFGLEGLGISSAHVPMNDVTYKTARCMEWKLRIQLNVKMLLDNQIADTTIWLVPCLNHEMQDVSFSVVSIAKPNCP